MSLFLFGYTVLCWVGDTPTYHEDHRTLHNWAHEIKVQPLPQPNGWLQLSHGSQVVALNISLSAHTTKWTAGTDKQKIKLQECYHSMRSHSSHSSHRSYSSYSSYTPQFSTHQIPKYPNTQESKAVAISRILRQDGRHSKHSRAREDS